jgi:hypothetical protein
MQFEIGNPSRQRFRRLVEEIVCCRTEQKILLRAPALATVFVNAAAEDGKKVRSPLHLVDDHQLIVVESEKEIRIGDFGQVRRVFEVEVKCGVMCGDVECQGRLAYLTRPKQRHGWILAKQFLDSFLGGACYHPCKFNIQY